MEHFDGVLLPQFSAEIRRGFAKNGASGFDKEIDNAHFNTPGWGDTHHR